MAAGSQVKPNFKHGIGGYSSHGCRCSICKDAAIQKRVKERNRLRGTEPNKHGTLRSYNVYGCRCEICTTYHSEYGIKYKKDRIGNTPIIHGGTGYSIYGCRCKICNEANMSYRLKQKYNPVVIVSERERGWRRKGIKNYTYKDYISMYKEQNGNCAICNNSMEISTTRDSELSVRRVANVDHNHDTGKVRALLCNDCNKMVGFGVTPDILRKGAEYINKYGVVKQ